MNRRTFITASVGMASVGCAMAALDWYGHLSELEPQQGASMSRLTLIDTRLAESRAPTADFSETGSTFLAVDADVGTLWHTHLRDWTGPISGVLRPSDCFVLRTFSLAQGRAFRFAEGYAAAGARREEFTPAGRASACRWTGRRGP